MSDIKCTSYVEGDWVEEGLHPCQCPVCKGWLKWVEGKPICNKCKTPLIALPDHDDYTGEKLECGRICPIPKKQLGAKKDES